MINTSIALRDNMTPTLRNLANQMSALIPQMERVDQESEELGQEGAEAMRDWTNATFIQINVLNNLNNTVENTTESIEESVQSTSNWATTMTGLYAVVKLIKMGIDVISKAFVIADEYTSINSRLLLINDSLQTQSELQDKIFRSATLTRSSYQAVADLVTKIGMTGAVKTNDEAIALAEKTNKLLKIGGGTALQNDSALLQFSQALASGRLQGDEFRSLSENAPALMQALAEGIGVTRIELKKMATDGELTTEVILKAFENMGDDINKKFEAIPRTFGDNMIGIQNVIGIFMAKLAQPDQALGRINAKVTEFVNWLNSEKGSKLLDNVAFALNLVSIIIVEVIDSFALYYELLSSVTGVLEGIFAAALVLVTALVWAKVTALWAMIPPLIIAVTNWLILNYPILLVAGAIGLVVAIMVELGVTTEHVVAFVGAIIGFVIADTVNYAVFFVNTIGELMVFFQNLFIDPVFAIQNLFYNLVDNVLGYFNSLVGGVSKGLNALIGGINKVTGLNIGTLNDVSVSNFLKKPTSDKAVKTFEKRQYVDKSDYGLAGMKKALGMYGNIKSKVDNRKGFGNVNIPDNAMGAGKELGDIGKVGKVGKIESDVNIADEDIKMLMDMVVQNRVNQINVVLEQSSAQVTNHNYINKSTDIDEVIDKIAETIDESVYIKAKGSY